MANLEKHLVIFCCCLSWSLLWLFLRFSLACDSLRAMNFACTIDISLRFGQLYARERQNSTHTDKAIWEYTRSIVVLLIKDRAENISKSPYFCPSVPLKKASYSLLWAEGHVVSLEDPKAAARGFKGQSYRDRSFCELAGVGTFSVAWSIEKATAPFALKLFFLLPLYGFALFSLGVPSYLSFFFFSFSP